MSISISIVIPCFNSIKTLPKLTNCLNQITQENIEVIFVDDGSSDGSADYIEKTFTGAHIIKQSNRGLAHARNTGAKHAKGKYLQFIDSDDTIDPHKLTYQYKHAEQTGSDVVYSDWRMVIVKEGIEYPETWVVEESKTNYAVELMHSWWVPFHSYLIRKDAYFNVGGSNEELINAQDFDLVLRMAMKKMTFSYLPGKFSVYYRYININSLARGNKKRYWNDYLKAINEAHINIEQIDDKTEFKRAIASRLFYIARNVYKYDKKQNKEIMEKIYEINPNFKPDGSFTFNIFFRLFGYNTAEYLSSIKQILLK